MPRPDLIPSRGAIAEPLLMDVTREITAEDLLRLTNNAGPKVGVPILQKLRATHHRQAQLLAQGKNLNEVAAIVGCTVQRLVQLQIDPMFAELISYYHDQLMVNAMDDASRLQSKITDLGEQAVDELLERMENDASRKTMRTGDVRQIAEFAMDRTVAPPKATTSAQLAPSAITINFGTSLVTERSEGAMEPAITAGSAKAVKTIEGEVVEPNDEAKTVK